jgi:hypothetical protein
MPVPIPKMPMKKPAPAKPAPEKVKITFGRIEDETAGQIIILAGKGGSGKTTAALMKPGETAFFDLEDTLPTLKTRIAEIAPERLDHIHVAPFEAEGGARDYEKLCELMEADGYDGMNTVVIDSHSVVQEILKPYTFITTPFKDSKGNKPPCNSVEDYPFGTFPSYARINYARLWNAIQTHKRAGRDVIIIAHAIMETIPDQNMNDMKQWQFDAYTAKSGKDALREFMFNNADQVWFLDAGLRRCVDDRKKVKTEDAASGGRFLHVTEEPLIQVKSRTYCGDSPLFIADGDTLPWNEILGRAE